MRLSSVLGGAMILQASVAPAFALALEEPEWSSPASVLLVQRARTCKDVRTCREAVELWCGGYSRADGDGDGIPCENVCSSKREVDAIRKEIGC